MKTFIERNPKEKAVEDSIKDLASAGYISKKADPADSIFEVAARLKRQGKRRHAHVDSSPSL
ncbi:hypothetical protein IFT48_01020 [Pseudomonas fluorescens]|uniref:hypothetical protein n=1 Tax=Pseudomonas fluorescens TaxID=294 RepID=UPI001930A6A2|nr:hypothetical protein [Pseudomonas fluorescens]MBD8088574.1 hypothetical protein [Pseudomonas fluorescens]